MKQTPNNEPKRGFLVVDPEQLDEEGLENLVDLVELLAKWADELTPEQCLKMCDSPSDKQKHER